MSGGRRQSLSERLADLTSAAPSTTFDPDAPDFDDGTGAGLFRYDDHDEELQDARASKPSAGLRIAADMESIGQEYHGKRVSRKSLAAHSGTVGDVPDPEDSEGGSWSDGAGEELDNADGGAIASINLDDISSSEDEEDGEDEKQAYEDYEDGNVDEQRGERRRGGDGGRTEQANVFAGVKGEGVDAMVENQMMQLDRQDEKARKGRGLTGQGELKRAREALRQRQWWDSLLEVRILLQRLMNAANRLPGPNELPLFLEGDEALTSLAEEASNAARGLANTLSATRQSHMACWGINAIASDSATMCTSTAEDEGDDNDDASKSAKTERTSADSSAEKQRTNRTEVDMDVEAEGEGKEPAEKKAQELKKEESAAAKDHGLCMSWWERILGRWHERTQLVDPGLQRKFKVVNQGPWAQVTASLADRERANRRAFMTEGETDEFLGRKLAKRLKKANNRHAGEGSAASGIIGEHRGADGDDGNAVVEVLGRERRKEADALDLEVIDDRDLYQHLLKEFMDTSGGSGNGYGASAGVPVRRKSRKKTVDRRASKGRKIKYVTHPKMQNFMFPQEYPASPMEPSELFSSLFGGAGGSQNGVTTHQEMPQ